MKKLHAWRKVLSGTSEQAGCKVSPVGVCVCLCVCTPLLLKQAEDDALANAAGRDDVLGQPGDLAKLLKELQAVKPTLDVAYDVLRDNSIRKYSHMPAA